MIVSFIGLGTMGKPMACNLINAGYNLRVFNRTQSKMNSLVEMGATGCSSPADCAKDADVIITILSDSPDVEEIILGENGILITAKKNSIIIDMSTISPKVAEKISEECRIREINFLDAPVTGGEKGAIEGTLSILVGGDESILEKAKPIFDVLGSKVTYFGKAGSGQAAKLCNQVICALNIVAMSEGLALAEAFELDLETLLSAISGGAAGSWMLTNLGNKIKDNDYNPGFRIALQQKDIRLALESAEDLKMPLIGLGTSHQIFRIAEAMGLGDDGTQALYKAIISLR
ncbi:MAG: NAD(P)-dependent oxidoreductase [Armatimonadota bacterium]